MIRNQKIMLAYKKGTNLLRDAIQENGQFALAETGSPRYSLFWLFADLKTLNYEGKLLCLN